MEDTSSEQERPLTSESSVRSIESIRQNLSSRGSAGPLTHESSKDTVSTDDPAKPHRTALNLTLAIAYPKPTDEHSRILEELVKKNKRTIENPKPIHFLHCEYSIAPDNEITSTDVVTYAVAAKVFTEADSRVVKTWDDGRQIWVAWIHSHEVDVSLENVASLHNHEIEVKLYDAKEKISSKARSDRPKAFRLPSDTEFKFAGQGVHGVVSKVSSSWFSAQPRNFGGSDAPLSPLVDPNSPDIQVDGSDSPEKDQQSEKGRSSVLGKLAGINPSDEEKKRLNELKQQKSTLQKQLSKTAKRSQIGSEKKPKTPTSKDGDGKKSKKGRKGSEKKLPIADRGKCVTMKIKLENLFAGIKTVASRLEDRSGSVIDAFVTISTEKSILPSRMEEILNPMCIKIRSAKDLPNTPIPQAELAKTSKPVFCQYNFMDLPLHATRGRPHGKHVYFEDTHVVFLGTMNPGALREFILSNSFQVELHDRDMLEDEDSGEGIIFGIEKSDEDISNVALVSAKRTAYNAFKSVKRAYDPFGVAKIPLIDLLRGQTSVSAEAVVSPCTVPEFMTESNSKDNKDLRLVGVPGAVDRPERPPQLPGDYFQAGTTLKIKITLSSPLVSLLQAPRLLPLPKQINPFSRIVIYFDYKNKDLLQRLENFVTMANAQALGLDGLGNKSVIDAALSTFKLTKQQKQSLTLDIITGFHLIDGNIHLMVLEGLQDGAMQRLLNEVDLSKKKDDEVLVHLYDTSLTFKNRIYSALDVDMCRVRLHQTISEIMSQPLLYVRDIIPRDCLECVSKLNQMLKLHKLRDVVFSQLFPTSEMVISMSREFGIPLTYEDFENEKPKTQVQNAAETIEASEAEQLLISETVEPVASKKSRMAELDNTNANYERLLRARNSEATNIDHVSANIIAVQEAGKRRRPSHPSVRSLQVEMPAHNYSSQRLNTTVIAKNLLREMLQETDPRGRYSYSADFLSSMLTPVDVDAHYRKLDRDARGSWKTPEGFVFPGRRTSAEDNQHPLKPVEYRIEDLKKSFRDNLLHRNIMEPILERDNYKWKDRSKDLNLLSKPIPNFGSTAPYSIMLAGDLKKEEQNRFKAEEREEWRKRLIVKDPLMRFHRLLWETEDSNYANQLDKLAGILKDRPIKYSLAKRPAPNIPPLAVLMYPSVDRAARESGVKLPPAFDEDRDKTKGFVPGPDSSRRWVMEGNKIPIKDEEHLVFASKHGHDMKLLHRERGLLSTRILVKPLTAEEYKTHLFKIPPPETTEDEEIRATAREEEIFGKGPRERSEYRVKFPAHESLTRLRELYPRHTFHGFAPMNKDGKSLNRDASIQLTASDTNQYESTEEFQFPSRKRPERGTILKEEASVEITPRAAPSNAEVA